MQYATNPAIARPINRPAPAASAAGANAATVVGTAARIDIDRVWYVPTTFRVVLPDGTVIEEYESEVEGRGMQYQAHAAERLVRDGVLEGDLLPIAESVAIMGTLDEIRSQIGVRYPGEEADRG